MRISDWSSDVCSSDLRLKGSPDEPRKRGFRRQFHLLAGAAVLHLNNAGGKPLRPDNKLPGQDQQVGSGEFRAAPLVSVVIESVLACRRQLCVDEIGRAPV